jgi:hypothetical protein
MHPILVGDHEPQRAVRVDDVDALDRNLSEILGLPACRSAAVVRNASASDETTT